MGKGLAPAYLAGRGLLEFVEGVTDEVEWIAEGLFTEPSINMIYATDGIGKSLIGVQAASELASGLPVFGVFPSSRAFKVVYVMAERSIKEPAKRIKRMLTDAGFKDRFIAENLLITTTFQGKDLSRPETAGILLEHIKQLGDEIGGIDLVFFDPLYALVRGDLKSDEAISSVFNFFRTLSTDTGASIFFIHHENRGNRNEEGKRAGQDYYGNKFISGLCTAVWHMVKVGEKDEFKTALINEKDTESALPARVTLHFNPEVGTVKADIDHNPSARDTLIESFLKKAAKEKLEFTSDDFIAHTRLTIHPVSVRRLMGKLKQNGLIKNISSKGHKALYVSGVGL